MSEEYAQIWKICPEKNDWVLGNFGIKHYLSMNVAELIKHI